MRGRKFDFKFGFSVKFRVDWYVFIWGLFVLHPFLPDIAFNTHAIAMFVQIIGEITIDPI